MGLWSGEETAVEAIKRSSDHLRGPLAAELASDAPNVSEDAEQLLKFHGVYAQDHRDSRRERSVAGLPLEFIFMLRVAIPGGRLTTEQYLALDRLADDVADGTIRLTTRQAVQFHGVAKAGLRPLVTELERNLLTSFAGCGDVARNVVACPVCTLDDPAGDLARLTDHLAVAFRPASTAYYELFVEGKPAVSREVGPERSFYGETYLPRKFKIGIANPDENCIDVLAQDLGITPAVHEELGAGYQVTVGGGLGRSYANDATFARLADPLTFVTNAELTPLIEAVLATYRDLGDRTDRRHARLKYVVAELGIDAFAAEVAARLGAPLRPPLEAFTFAPGDDHLGWATQPDGNFRVGIRIGAGRIADVDGGPQLRSALRHLATTYRGLTMAATAEQDLVVAGIGDGDRAAVEQVLLDHGIRSADELGPVERNALACVALPTCSQALAEAERKLPDLVTQLEAALLSSGPAGERVQLRLTGCPNGCARPTVAEIGVVGRTKSSYDLYLGGGPRGDRLNTLVAEKVKFDDLGATMAPLFARWEQERTEGETFGDFAARVLVP